MSLRAKIKQSFNDVHENHLTTKSLHDLIICGVTFLLESLNKINVHGGRLPRRARRSWLEHMMSLRATPAVTTYRFRFWVEESDLVSHLCFQRRQLRSAEALISNQVEITWGLKKNRQGSWDFRVWGL